MWLPLTSRSCALPRAARRGAALSPTHGPGGVDEDARLDLAPPAAPSVSRHGRRLALRRDERGAGGDLGAAQGRVAGDGDGQPGIVDDAIGIDETVRATGH